MCRGVDQGCTVLRHDQIRHHIHGYYRKESESAPPPAPAPAPAGLAAFEAELTESQVESTSSLTHSLPIPIVSSSAHHEEVLASDQINIFSASDHQQSEYYHTTYRIGRKRYYKGEAQKSLFFTAVSPPDCNSSLHSSCSSDLGTSLPDFLGACVSCKHPLRPGKDIYMYRGDRAFCSTECRYMHIVADESFSCATIGQQCDQSSSSIDGSRLTHVPTINVLG